MTINPDTLVRVYRVESEGRINTFESLDASMPFIRQEIKLGKTPLNLSISSVKRSEYLVEVEEQEAKA
jgi:hypothetical protein